MKMIRKYTLNTLPKEYYNKTYCVFEFETFGGEYPDVLWLAERLDKGGHILIEHLQRDECRRPDKFKNKMKEFLEAITVDTCGISYNVQLDIDLAEKYYGAKINTIKL